jgi:hypothetical protein
LFWLAPHTIRTVTASKPTTLARKINENPVLSFAPQKVSGNSPRLPHNSPQVHHKSTTTKRGFPQKPQQKRLSTTRKKPTKKRPFTAAR